MRVLDQLLSYLKQINVLVSQVTDMRFMFSNTTSFNQPLNNWVVSNVFIMAPIARRVFLIKI